MFEPHATKFCFCHMTNMNLANRPLLYITGNFFATDFATDKMSVKCLLISKLSVTGLLSNNLSVKCLLTDKLPVNTLLNCNLLVKSLLIDKLSVKPLLIDEL